MLKPSKVYLQNEFVKTVVRFLTWLDINGYVVTFGEAYRPPWACKVYAENGQGIEDSLHTERLALDLNIFKNGNLLTSVEDLKIVGEVWEGFSTQELVFNWGGRFLRTDADHFSMSIPGDNRK